jgi:hypothetical protein
MHHPRDKHMKFGTEIDAYKFYRKLHAYVNCYTKTALRIFDILSGIVKIYTKGNYTEK